jgi:hypothetical protein
MHKCRERTDAQEWRLLSVLGLRCVGTHESTGFRTTYTDVLVSSEARCRERPNRTGVGTEGVKRTTRRKALEEQKAHKVVYDLTTADESRVTNHCRRLFYIV